MVGNSVCDERALVLMQATCWLAFVKMLWKANLVVFVTDRWIGLGGGSDAFLKAVDDEGR